MAFTSRDLLELDSQIRAFNCQHTVTVIRSFSPFCFACLAGRCAFQAIVFIFCAFSNNRGGQNQQVFVSPACMPKVVLCVAMSIRAYTLGFMYYWDVTISGVSKVTWPGSVAANIILAVLTNTGQSQNRTGYQ